MQTTGTGHNRTAAGAIHIAALSGESTCRARAVAAKLESVICDCGEFTGPHLVIGETEAWLEMDGRQVRIAFDSATMLHRRRGGQNELNSLHDTISVLRSELEEAENKSSSAVQRAISSSAGEIKSLQLALTKNCVRTRSGSFTRPPTSMD